MMDRKRAQIEEQTGRGKPANYRGWQSDVIVDLIKRYGFPHITLNPGASFRGLHDSLVNYGGNDVTLAMERGEVKGRCGWSWSSVVATHKRWIDDKSIIILVQLSLSKHPDLADVPLVMDFAKTEDQQQIFKLIFARQVMGRPYLAPPGVPKERADALRKAFMDTMKDPEFLSDAEKSQLEINPVSGADVEQLVKDIYQTPKALADKAAEFIRH